MKESLLAVAALLAALPLTARAMLLADAAAAARSRVAQAHESLLASSGLCGDSTLDKASFSVEFENGSPFAGQNFKAYFGDCEVEDDYLGEPMEPRASRIYSGGGTRWGLVINTWKTSTTAHVGLVYRVGRSWRHAGSLGMVSVRDLFKTGAVFALAELIDYNDWAKPAKATVTIKPAP